jgi:hypothetical protein
MPYGTVNADVIGTSVANSNLGAGNASNFKNRMINGGCVINQYATTYTVNNTEQFPVDRIPVRCNVSGISATTQQSSTAPSNFKNSIVINVTTGATPSGADRGYMMQKIEGYNVADFMLGTATAVTFTFSFWVRSSLTGTFSGAFQNENQNRSYVFTYTINAANTWEQKTITVAGDTTGTWATGNTGGLFVLLNLGNGPTLLSSTTNSWIAGDYRGATSSTAIFANSGATFYTTGWQLEVGSLATGFEFRSVGTELALCQRYCLGFGGGTSGGTSCLMGLAFSSNQSVSVLQFPVQMRGYPSLTVATPSNFYTNNIGANTNSSTLTANTSSATTGEFFATLVSSALTGGQAIRFFGNNSSLAIWSAEL